MWRFIHGAQARVGEVDGVDRVLVELGRAGLLTPVQPPTPEDEAVRDLARARDDAREDLQRCRHRLGELLRRRLHYYGRNWTRGHREDHGLEWTHAAERTVVDDYLLAIDHTEARLLELNARLAEIAENEPYREPVGWLRCFRGIDTLTAMLILAEVMTFAGSCRRRRGMAYLGLVPGEDSAGRNTAAAASRARAMPWSGDCSWKSRGVTNTDRARGWRSHAGAKDNRRA